MDSEFHLITGKDDEVVNEMLRVLWSEFGGNVQAYVDKWMEQGEIEVEQIVGRAFMATADLLLRMVLNGDLQATTIKAGVHHAKHTETAGPHGPNPAAAGPGLAGD